jgi:2-haloalkanoic acid dehalogenase type II
MFQTLVSIDSRRQHIWQVFLKERYSEQLAEECWALSSKSVIDHYHRLTSQSKPFLTLKSIFEAGFAELFPTIGLDFDPNEAARILVTQHRSAFPYEDTKAFLASVGEKYPICLVTDTDDDMLSPSLLGLHEFDSVFTSEQLRSYKNDPECKLFSAVVKHYGIAPEKILHIGDSSADVLGAHRVGMKACWLNRSGNLWQHDIEPDYTVRTLLEAASILGVSPRYQHPR